MILTLRNRLKALIWIAALALLVMSVLEGGRGEGLSIQRLTVLEAVLFAVITIFDRWLWRWWFVPRLMRTGPVLRGTWQGVIRPTDETGTAIPAYLSVRQTFSGIAFRLMTKESTSESSTARLTIEGDGLVTAEYSYQNTPRDAVRSDSPIHFGATRLECIGARPARLEGSYFTDRRTTGELELSARSKKISHAYVDAEGLFSHE